MIFDIIEISNEEVEMLDVIQLKMLRTAQQKKDALSRKMSAQLREYKVLLYSNNIFESDLYRAKEAELTEEYEYEVGLLREQLLFNLSLREPVEDEEEPPQDDYGVGYVVDYRLSYLERYVAVRDYYLTIEDPDERLALYARDEVAIRYLDSYYNHLFNYLGSLR